MNARIPMRALIASTLFAAAVGGCSDAIDPCGGQYSSDYGYRVYTFVNEDSIDYTLCYERAWCTFLPMGQEVVEVIPIPVNTLTGGSDVNTSFTLDVYTDRDIPCGQAVFDTTDSCGARIIIDDRCPR